MAIGGRDADCTGVMDFAGGARGARRGDGHHSDGGWRDERVMAIVRLSQKSGGEAAR
jgi:hypothetical protein